MPTLSNNFFTTSPSDFCALRPNENTLAPCLINTGVFGITRTTLDCSGNNFSIEFDLMPAAIEIIRCLGVTKLLMSANT
ncbi:hypothetical protein DERF_001867 [Dermatophagoides farinae]|uniref:Uncharacterized protein n=1 Tax=Dermatophagoides farinae TaxID=6954 RepID=A0A922IBP7_DERFA|nr:hypothetical protein DERF_001867 [Dermatophagoides farinae]